MTERRIGFVYKFEIPTGRRSSKNAVVLGAPGALAYAQLIEGRAQLGGGTLATIKCRALGSVHVDEELLSSRWQCCATGMMYTRLHVPSFRRRPELCPLEEPSS